MKMRPFGRLLPPLEARRRLLSTVRPISRRETVPLLSAHARVAARNYAAPRAVPDFARASWDGYAIDSRATRQARAGRPVKFRVVGDVFAEGDLDRPLGPGEVAAIATGGAMPDGADAVVIFEDVRLQDGAIELIEPVGRGDHVAERGEDYRKGAMVVQKEEWLTPAALGGLAAIGRTDVEVYSRPRVTIIPNGNELLAPGEPPAPRKIYEANNLTLAGLVQAAGGVPAVRRPVPDDPDRIESAIRGVLAGSDLVLVTGGSSVGEHDFLPQVLPKIGRLLFHGIAVRPGKPTLAVDAAGKLVMGMPGHPTSNLSNGFWLLLPVLRKLARLPGPGWFDGTARLDAGVTAPTAGLSTIVPLRVVAGRATPTFHHSSAITSLSGTNAFAMLPPGAVRLAKGARVPVHYLLPPLALPPERGAGSRS